MLQQHLDAFGSGAARIDPDAIKLRFGKQYHRVEQILEARTYAMVVLAISLDTQVESRIERVIQARDHVIRMLCRIELRDAVLDLQHGDAVRVVREPGELGNG